MAEFFRSKVGRRLLFVSMGVFLLLCVAGAIKMVRDMKTAFTQKVVQGWANAQPLIEKSPYLQRQWQGFHIDLAKAVILEAVVAPEGMMQAGPYFYIKCKYADVDIATLKDKWKDLPQTTGTWTFGGGSIRFSGTRYEFEQAGGDGPSSHAVIDQADPTVIHYYAYAGDG